MVAFHTMWAHIAKTREEGVGGGMDLLRKGREGRQPKGLAGPGPAQPGKTRGQWLPQQVQAQIAP